ncbi:MAG: tetratricopeptide repeat protein [Microcoleaceae cyanobacterium]
MGYSIEINPSNFNAEVIEKSNEKPILIDFFATWCGPCQILKPMLESLLAEYDFILAYVDIDQNPELANQYHVEGVPDVRVVVNQEVKPGFVGVLPEDKIRDLLSQFNLKSGLEIGLEEIQTCLKLGEIEQAKTLFDQLLKQYPNQPTLIIKAAHFMIKNNQVEVAKDLLNQVSEYDRKYGAKATALKQLIELKASANQSPDDNDDGNQLERDYAKACHLTLIEQYSEALPLWLKIVEQNREYRNDGARKAMLTIFELLGPEHSLTQEYRKNLMLSLY